MIALLAVQLPLCCCEVRAAVAVLAHAGHGADDSDEADDCCAKAGKRDCCAPASDSVDADDAADGHAPAQGDCCLTCKDRAAPTIAPSIDVDTLHTLNFVASAVLATVVPGDDAGLRAPAPSHRDTGPPGAPGGRLALLLHSTLVI